VPKPIIQGPYRTFRRLNEDETFLEFEGSTITIPMKGRRGPAEPWMEDEVKLKAFMRLEVSAPYVNNLKTREFQFIIRDWYLHGKSPMLNRLFFEDPRGLWLGELTHGQFNDYAPAVVTFSVTNHYAPLVISPEGLRPDEIFGPVRDLEIRNLTSHHLRTWVDLPERGVANPVYSLPSYTIYWQVVLPETIKEHGDVRRLTNEWNGAPLLVFHNKPPQRVDGQRVRDGFDVRNAPDRTGHILAVAQLSGEKRAPIRAVSPTVDAGRRLEGRRVHATGNSVLSPLAQPRKALEILWRLADNFDMDRLLDAMRRSDSQVVSGAVKIVSPSKSVCTADQRPDLGDPIDSADFPARITYAINYNIAINKEIFVEDDAGIAIAVGVTEIPPRDVTVAFDKPHVGHVLQQYLEFGPGHCTGMHEIPQTEYDAGVNFCRYWRKVPLDPADAGWANFKDFDPAIEY
jgi:hypothetical protein